jgi:hypothetical protein
MVDKSDSISFFDVRLKIRVLSNLFILKIIPSGKLILSGSKDLYTELRRFSS